MVSPPSTERIGATASDVLCAQAAPNMRSRVNDDYWIAGPAPIWPVGVRRDRRSTRAWLIRRGVNDERPASGGTDAVATAGGL
jgi:hypothetical protein